jgi:hypothetical protein
MEFLEILLAYVNFLWATFQVDIWVFSQWWAYAFLCIPALGYLIFFTMKWSIITMPIWYIPAKIFGASPLGAINQEIKKQINKKKEKKL